MTDPHEATNVPEPLEPADNIPAALPPVEVPAEPVSEAASGAAPIAEAFTRETSLPLPVTAARPEGPSPVGLGEFSLPEGTDGSVLSELAAETQAGGERSVAEQAAQAGITEAPPALTPSRPRRKLTALWISLAGVAFLALLLAGGYFGYRYFAATLVNQANAEFQAGNYAASEATINRRLGLPLQGLLAPANQLVVIRGKAVFKQGRFDQALPDLDAGKGTNPADGEPYLYMTEIYLKHGLFDEALALANEAQKRNDQWGLPYTLQAVQAYRELRYVDALAGAEKALQCPEPMGMAYRVRGSILAWQEDLSGAEADLNQAIQMDENDNAARTMRAMLYFKLDREGEAQADVDAVVATAPDSPDGLWVQAMAALYRNDAARAQDLLNQAIELDGQRPEFYLYRSLTYLHSDQEKDALADLTQALDMHPDWAEPIYLQAVSQFNRYEAVDIGAEADNLDGLAPDGLFGSYLALGQNVRLMEYDKALGAAEAIITARPGVSDGFVARGMVYLDQHELDKAGADFDKAAQINPFSSAALAGQAQVAIARRQYPKALEVLAKAVQVAPQAAPLFALRAQVYLIQKEEDKASQDIAAAFQLDPSSADAYKIRALFNLVKKNKDNLQAMSDINKVSELYPNAPEAMLIRSLIYLDNKDYDRAREELLKAQKIDDKEAAVFTGLARADVAQKKNDSAIVNAKLAVDLAPWSEDAYLALGQAYLQANKPEDAILNLKKSLEINPDQVQIYFTLFEAHQKSDDYEPSIEDLNTLMAHKEELTLEEVDTVEKKLAYLKDNPPPPFGFRSYRDEKNGFKLFYQDEWDEGTIDSKDKHTTLILDQDTRQGYARIYLGFDETSGKDDTPEDFGDYVRQQITGDGESFVKRKDFKTPNYSGIVDTYRYQARMVDGTVDTIIHQVYVFIVGDKIIYFDVYASEGWSEDIIKNAEVIVQSFKLI
jgi:tetratricopeptide (TPR) repeat protein